MHNAASDRLEPMRYVGKFNGHSRPMCDEQENNLKYIINEVSYLLNTKYRKGDEEHGGSLIELEFRTLLDHSINEALDQLAYLVTMKRKLLRGGL